jgi:hypothetical protein
MPSCARGRAHVLLLLFVPSAATQGVPLPQTPGFYGAAPGSRCVTTCPYALDVSNPEPPDSESAAQPGSRSVRPLRWHQRPTVRALRRGATRDESSRAKQDREDNEETRLPAAESIAIGGIVLAEVFTPSTVSALYRSLEAWPIGRRDRKEELLAALARSRGGARGGWQSLGVVRPPGAFTFGDGYTDAALPAGVDAVWLRADFLVPSLTVVVATFTLTDDAADLSRLLRANYNSRTYDVRLRVKGRLGPVRGRIPWARPARPSLGYSISRAEDEKRRAFETRIGELERACAQWLTDKFPGRFARADWTDCPVMRLLFTERHVPFTKREPWFRPVGLNQTVDVWRSTDHAGWALATSSLRREPDQTLIVAARRADAAEDPGGPERNETNWSLTQVFADDQAPLATRWALLSVLSLYAKTLANLRDRASDDRRFRRPVRQARALDAYLIGDGLDVLTITSDVRVLTEELTRFGWSVPQYTEDLHGYPEGYRAANAPRELVPSLCSWLRDGAGRLADDTEGAARNIRASAELRQAIANTTLQRRVLALTFFATVVAVVSLLAGC